MRIVMFYHSLISDWNHGNAHFLRGVVSELISRGHQVDAYEPFDSWSFRNLIAEHGSTPIRKFRTVYPELTSVRYDSSLDLNEALDGADLVIVHEWNNPELIKRIGRHRARSRSYRLLFHDTHHRSVSDPKSMSAFDLSHYDGVLAFGNVIRDLYLKRSWIQRAWTWHEAADTRIFRPMRSTRPKGDVVWIGNWGDDERTAELNEYLFKPVRALGLRACVHGVRYPDKALKTLARHNIHYAGWIANYEVPKVFARYRATVHIPRRPYVHKLPGIPTIRPFEALACGIPLICSPWEDTENLFSPGKDFLIAQNGRQMKQHLRDILHDKQLARTLWANGLETILRRHTCAHRVDELLGICRELGTNKKINERKTAPLLGGVRQ